MAITPTSASAISRLLSRNGVTVDSNATRAHAVSVGRLGRNTKNIPEDTVIVATRNVSVWGTCMEILRDNRYSLEAVRPSLTVLVYGRHVKK